MPRVLQAFPAETQMEAPMVRPQGAVSLQPGPVLSPVGPGIYAGTAAPHSLVHPAPTALSSGSSSNQPPPAIQQQLWDPGVGGADRVAGGGVCWCGCSSGDREAAAPPDTG